MGTMGGGSEVEEAVAHDSLRTGHVNKSRQDPAMSAPSWYEHVCWRPSTGKTPVEKCFAASVARLTQQ